MSEPSFGRFQSFVPESSGGYRSGFDPRSKKPFCNAFTGCGKKRADPDLSDRELWDLLAAKIESMRSRNREVRTTNIGIIN